MVSEADWLAPLEAEVRKSWIIILTPLASLASMIVVFKVVRGWVEGWQAQDGAAHNDEEASVALRAEARYDVLVSKLHAFFEMVGMGMIGQRLFLWRNSHLALEDLGAAPSVAPMVRDLWLESLIVYVLATLCAFVMLHRVTYKLGPTTRNRVYRIGYTSQDVTFRTIRIWEVFHAEDAATFVRAAQTALQAQSAAQTWICFVAGYFIGVVQPRSPRWRLVYALLCSCSFVLPQAVAWLHSGESVWLLTAMRVLALPFTFGYLVESGQRHLILSLLSSSIRNELAIDLPRGTMPRGTRAGKAGGATEEAPTAEAATAAAATAARGPWLSFFAPLSESAHERPGADAPGGGNSIASGSGSSSSSGSSERDAVGLIISKLEPVGVLGFGGSAQVRLMRDMGHTDSRLLAVKSVFKARGGRALSAESVSRVHEELAVLQRASSHPFIVNFHGWAEDEHCYHFALEYAASGPLSAWLQREELQEPVARTVGAECLSGLRHLHGMRIIYRDLKPENVLVLSSGHVCLADFGVSRRLDEGSHRYGAATTPTPGLGATSMVGTPGYMAPEMLRRSEVTTSGAGTRRCRVLPYSFAVDFWALGVLLHIMLALEEPLRCDTMIDIMDTAQDAHEVLKERIAPELSPAARDVVLGLLAFDVRERLGAAGGVAEIMAHEFFADVDFERLERLEEPPPFPKLTCFAT